MYTTNLRVSNYNDRHYKMEINGSWITLTDLNTNQVVCKRHADEGVWYDAAHKKVVKALHDLEESVFALVDADKK